MRPLWVLKQTATAKKLNKSFVFSLPNLHLIVSLKMSLEFFWVTGLFLLS